MKIILMLAAFTFGVSVFAQQPPQLAASADQMLKEAAGGHQDTSSALFRFTKLVLPWMVAEANGDEAKLNMLIEEGRTNPKAFLNRLPPDLRSQVEAIAQQLEAGKKPAVPVP